MLRDLNSAGPDLLYSLPVMQEISALDDRAQKSLGSLEAAKALEVLQKVEELVEAQGATRLRCNNVQDQSEEKCRSQPFLDAAIGMSQNGKEDALGKEYWTVKRIEKAAERAFETWYEGDRWRLKFSMAGLDPSLSDIAMERCMAWLRRRLAEFKDASGPKVLRQCRAEVDFSQNDMSDRALWMLLDCLTQFEVQASYLKLNNNRISGAGMLALCEFIRNNKRAGQIYELHLSQNEIDDASALELFRTLKELKHRYPPKREIHGYEGLHLVPLWLRLSRNKIRDPAALLETLTAEEITFCPALRRDGCGPGYCSWEDTPLVHLPFFSEQARFFCSHVESSVGRHEE
ncbi:CHR12 [Symbiodinium sp. KB8]|nr:CHR12 [Symbiodinium sp. KB8]